jgi:uncharacterized membrane protein
MYHNEENKPVTYAGEDYTGRIDQIYKQMTRAIHENGASFSVEGFVYSLHCGTSLAFRISAVGIVVFAYVKEELR